MVTAFQRELTSDYQHPSCHYFCWRIFFFLLQVIYNGVEKSCTAKSLKPNTEYTITVSWRALFTLQSIPFVADTVWVSVVISKSP